MKIYNKKEGKNEIKQDQENKEDQEKKEEKEAQKYIPLNFDVDFDSKVFKFYTPNSKKSLEELYKSGTNQIKKKIKFLFL